VVVLSNGVRLSLLHDITIAMAPVLIKITKKNGIKNLFFI